jgi:hypothetical protein
VRGLWGKKTEPVPPEPPKPVTRRKVDTNTIRTRLSTLGWKLREIPIRRNSPDSNQRVVLLWKVIAVKGEKSVEVGGPTIDEAMKTIGKTLGVIPQG